MSTIENIKHSMSLNQPFVSILMPVFNGEKYLVDSIKSILEQTYTKYEFIIINDGSIDNSEKVILSFNDNRIKYIKQNKNKNIVATLNRGLSIAKGVYIIRMDQDDISLPVRIEKQVSFMESKPKIGVSGFDIIYFGVNQKNKNKNKLKIETCSKQIKINLLTGPFICHPTAIIRKSILDKHNIQYRKEYEYAEDYDLWVQLSKVCLLGNLKEVLLEHRVHKESMSSTGMKLQIRMMKKIKKKQIESLTNCSISEKELQFITKWSSGSILIDFKFFLFLIIKNRKKKYYHQRKFFYYLFNRMKYSVMNNILSTP